jgi:SAM-dependent methyltransferase
MRAAKGAPNERLTPPWSSSRYHVLVGLREALNEAITSYVRAGSTVVDFGCGDRPYEPLVTARRAAYVGADLPGRSVVDRSVDKEGRIDAPDGSADVVLSTQVLEHVDDPSSYLREAHRVLSRDGILILSTHGYWKYHPDPNDFWRWTSSGIKRQIEDGGFEVLTVRGVLNLGSAGLQLLQDFVVSQVPPKLGTLTALVMQRIIGLVARIPDRSGQEPDAVLFLVVARRLQQ